MSTALTQEVRFAVGFKKQTDLTTPLVAGDMVSLRQTNTDFIQATPQNENDKDDLGKGVYITQVFPSFIDAKGNWNGRLSAEALAICTGFAIGVLTSKAATVGVGGLLYTYHEPTLATDGLDLPSTTMAVQIRTGGDAITDKALIGMACEEFGITMRQGPGRDNAGFTSSWLGTGSFAKPSTITIPDIYAENSMNAGNVTAATLIGFDYLSNKRFVNVDFKWKNNIRDQSSYYPGSGSQSGYQLRGRIRRGAPTITLSAQVECDSGSSEEDALLAQTEGTGRITIHGAQVGAGPEHFGWDLQLFRISANATPIADADGIATYQVEYNIMEHASNGVLEIQAITTIDNILTAA